MTADLCPRCRLAAESPHATEGNCIGALGAALAAVRLELDALEADRASRVAREQRARELYEESIADPTRGSG